MDNVYDPHTPRQPAYFSFFGLVGHIKNDDKTYYLACPEDSCRKKVIEENNNEFKCESCGKIYPTCVPTYKLLVKMNDLSDSLYVNFYRNEGTAVMRGVDAQQLVAMRETNDTEEVQKVFYNAMFKLHRVTVKCQYNVLNNGEERVNFTAIRLGQYRWSDHNRELLKRLHLFSGMPDKD